MSAIKSPCIRNCCLDKQDVCIGCGRTVEDIVQWGGADDAQKRSILQAAGQRKAARANRYGKIS